MRIYQHVDEFNERDGIGNDIRGFQNIFKSIGIESSIIARINNSKDKFDVYPIAKVPKFFSDDVHFLHYGGVGYPIEFFVESIGKKVLRFHNMTPIYFFKKYLSEDIFKTFEQNETRSLLELYSLHKSIDHVLCDSIFNEQDYIKIVRNKKKINSIVFPVIRHYPQSNREISGGFRIGFIGRWVPNKKLEDLLFTLYFLRKINSKYRLILIGKRNPIFSLYTNHIFNLMNELELKESIEICEDLNQFEMEQKLASLDLYLSMSEHEGFGIPILEAMATNVPVLAYSSSAVIETVRDAGLLFTKKDFPLIAELIHEVLMSAEIKAKLRQSQHARVKLYNDYPFAEKLAKVFLS